MILVLEGLAIMRCYECACRVREPAGTRAVRCAPVVRCERSRSRLVLSAPSRRHRLPVGPERLRQNHGSAVHRRFRAGPGGGNKDCRLAGQRTAAAHTPGTAPHRHGIPGLCTFSPSHRGRKHRVRAAWRAARRAGTARGRVYRHRRTLRARSQVSSPAFRRTATARRPGARLRSQA